MTIQGIPDFPHPGHPQICFLFQNDPLPQHRKVPNTRFLHALQAYSEGHWFKSLDTVPRSGRGPVPSLDYGRVHPLRFLEIYSPLARSTKQLGPGG
ncbi:hypothetical protein ACFX16_013265 [Malus domestica]